LIAVDTSALIAVTNHEPERARFLLLLASEDRRLISAVSLLETRMVVYGRFGVVGIERLETWLNVMPLEVVPFDEAQAAAAFAAFTIYGKGFNPRSRLNFCDCVAYALAKTFNVRLLFKGDDFLATDVSPAA
jgi:ribonuclease VapC